MKVIISNIVKPRILRAGISLIAGFAAVLLGTLLGTQLANAGHTYGPGGDCWRYGTPLVCNWHWKGADTYLDLTLVDQMGNSALHDKAETARSYWTNFQGPQWFSWYPNPWTPDDSKVYLKLDESLADIAPNGYTVPYDQNGNVIPASPGTGWLDWSEVYVTTANLNYREAVATQLPGGRRDLQPRVRARPPFGPPSVGPGHRPHESGVHHRGASGRGQRAAAAMLERHRPSRRPLHL